MSATKTAENENMEQGTHHESCGQYQAKVHELRGSLPRVP
jgi:hypothetical protein